MTTRLTSLATSLAPTVLLALGLLACDDAGPTAARTDLPRAVLAGSCEGACGEQAATGCYCDDACGEHGDCCFDQAIVCDGIDLAIEDASCVDRCGGQAPSGCYCDDACVEYGDCCADRADTCPSRTDGGAPCAQEIGLDCPAGQVDACLIDPAATHHACVDGGGDDDGDGDGDDGDSFPEEPGDDGIPEQPGDDDACAADDASAVGGCDLHLGYRWNGVSCEPLGGCGCEGDDCAALAEDEAGCYDAHLGCW